MGGGSQEWEQTEKIQDERIGQTKWSVQTRLGGKCDWIRGEARREKNTRKKAQIIKRQEIWACQMESADKNGWDKRQDKRGIYMRGKHRKERERADNKKTGDMNI